MNFPKLSFISKMSATALFIFALCPSAYAFNLNFDQLNISKKETISTTAFNLTFDSSDSILPFREKNMFDIFSKIKTEYLTFYSNKYEKVNASYSKGAYFLNYSSVW